MFAQQGPYGERCSISKANGLFTHLYLSETPVKEPYHEMGEKHTVTIHGAPHRQKAYIQWGAAWSTKGIITTLLTLPQCHAAFSTIPSALAWVDQCPVIQHALQ